MGPDAVFTAVHGILWLKFCQTTSVENWYIVEQIVLPRKHCQKHSLDQYQGALTMCPNIVY